MITVGMNYLVIPGKEETFEVAFRGVLKAMEDQPGHTESHLWKDTANSQSYLITSEWNDQAAFDAFIHSDQFRKIANWGKDQILASRPRHQVYETGK